VRSSNLSSWGGMIYCFDLDGTICTSVEKSQYEKALPDHTVVNEINSLYGRGDTIKIMTARGCVSGIDHTILTKRQLQDWGVKYHELIMNTKPHADWFIDDKGVHISEWKKQIPQVRGIVAGAFDLIHPGYIKMFKECKRHCTHLTIALHEDPSLARPNKPKPTQTVEERKEILKAIRYIDDIVVYQAEDTFLWYLESGDYNVRFLGDDYNDGSYTGKDIDINIVFVDRSHEYSTTKLKNKICESLK
jgi:glycerol-3-phosphate cytidylyltransferase